MCGRFSLVEYEDYLRDTINYDSFQANLESRYNVAPGQNIISIILNSEGKRKLGLMRWGLMPSWVKDVKKSSYRMINARCETVEQKPSFRHLFKRRRCIIPADSYYEWKKDSKIKSPVRIVMKNKENFSFAALWDRWQMSKDDDRDIDSDSDSVKEVISCTILTTRANNKLNEIHERMPVILDPAGEEIWLNRESEPLNLKQLFEPYSEKLINFYPVSSCVNSPRNDTEECILELKET